MIYANMLTRDNYINSDISIQSELLSLFNRNENLIIFDIGACEAEDSIRYSNLYPNSKVYAFEPRIDNVTKANELITKYKKTNIVLENIALSNTNGVADFYLSEGKPKAAENNDLWDYGNKSSSLLAPSVEIQKYTDWLQFNKKIQVNTVRLDDYTLKNSIQTIDFVHLDVQGAELIVLEGAGDFLKNIKLIWLEVESVELYKGQPLKNDVELFMTKNNFVNLLDTVDDVSGDQLYLNMSYYSNDKFIELKSLQKNKKSIFIRIKNRLKR
jgi:2-O-methyltransferase